ncbi:Werner Syndrome-like exonuclease [Anopheles funestus]|uniref:Werner Syndrome-like exonuclease n=1 Tax=Anopheles funestus TaxID=62324 RepID=UPI0020C62B3A|nr:Werner Syndrome-like exonuclease [Anopheles funestus]
MSRRKLPLWMCPPAEKCQRMDECTEKLEVPSASIIQSVDPPVRRLRSNYVFPSEEKKEAKVQIEYLPFIDYTGAIEYYTTLPDMAFRCNELMEQLLQQPQTIDQDIPIAFDLEWSFSFKTGPKPTALMQLCATTDRCLLLQVSCLKRLPAALLQLLYHPRVVLHGVNIKNDFRKLARDFPEVDADRLIERCVELGQWYNQLNGSTVRWSLAGLVEQVLKQRMNKDKKVRMSKWDVLPLSDDQKLYAAIDVYIGQKLYMNLAEKERQQENSNNYVLEADEATVGSKNVYQQTAVVFETLPLSNSNTTKQSPAIL